MTRIQKWAGVMEARGSTVSLEFKRRRQLRDLCKWRESVRSAAQGFQTPGPALFIYDFENGRSDAREQTHAEAVANASPDTSAAAPGEAKRWNAVILHKRWEERDRHVAETEILGNITAH